MTLAEETSYLLKRYGLRPDTDRGQNFLIDEKVLAEIIKAAELTPTDQVIEIGAGLGNLTTRLSAVVGRLVSYESDQRLQPLLSELSKRHPNLALNFEDFTKTSWPAVLANLKLSAGSSYKVVANIPYYLTGQIIEQLLSWPRLPTLLVLLVQKEVAERITAGPGDYSKLALSVQLVGQPEVVSLVAAKAFYPVPKVDSAILKITKLHAWNYPVAAKDLWQLIRISFASRRKTLANNLAAGLRLDKKTIASWLASVGLREQVRAQDLTVEQWVNLSRQRPT